VALLPTPPKDIVRRGVEMTAEAGARRRKAPA
jgi:hypothetical protein